MPNNNNILEAEIVVPLKYLSSFCRSLDLPLTNCGIELDLRMDKKLCNISAVGDPPKQEVATATTGATFQIIMLNFMLQLLFCIKMILSNF